MHNCLQNRSKTETYLLIYMTFDLFCKMVGYSPGNYIVNTHCIHSIYLQKYSKYADICLFISLNDTRENLRLDLFSKHGALFYGSLRHRYFHMRHIRLTAAGLWASDCRENVAYTGRCPQRAPCFSQHRFGRRSVEIYFHRFACLCLNYLLRGASKRDM